MKRFEILFNSETLFIRGVRDARLYLFPYSYIVLFSLDLSTAHEEDLDERCMRRQYVRKRLDYLVNS